MIEKKIIKQQLDGKKNLLPHKYLQYLDVHIEKVVSREVEEFKEINEIAEDLGVSHQYLSEVIQKYLGQHPCHFYDLKIIEKAKELLRNTQYSVAEVARILTYDPSNFSKFFKKFVGETPGQFRK